MKILPVSVYGWIQRNVASYKPVIAVSVQEHPKDSGLLADMIQTKITAWASSVPQWPKVTLCCVNPLPLQTPRQAPLGLRFENLHLLLSSAGYRSRNIGECRSQSRLTFIPDSKSTFGGYFTHVNCFFVPVCIHNHWLVRRIFCKISADMLRRSAV